MNTKVIKTENDKKIDYELLFVQVICIFGVINGHYGCVTTIISRLYPYYSWHMPFFIFISGILFARQVYKYSCFQYIRHKCYTLLFPALIINFSYGIISWFMRHYKFVSYGEKISFKTLFISPFLTNHQFDNDTSLWFIFQLFIIELIIAILYSIIKLITIKPIIKDIIWLIISFVLSAYALSSSMNITNKSPQLILLLRTCFLLFFFLVGNFYERYIRIYLKNWKYPIIGCIISIVIQMLLQTKIDSDDMIMYVQNMQTRTIPNFLLPYITFTTASILLLCSARFLYPILVNNRILHFINLDLRYIVYHHQFCAIFISFFSFILFCAGKKDLVPKFNPISYRIHPFYIHYFNQNYFVKLLYLLLLFCIPLCIAKIINKNGRRWIRLFLWMLLFLIILVIFTLTGRYYQDVLRNIR